MTMPGGGPWLLAPGQITDDSELAMCLLNALIEGNGSIDTVAHCKWYGKWMNSPPFDIGTTTSNGLSKCDPDDPRPSQALN
jgi:ADP-ribosyl-[dinitrogen reductase] hydrolase